MGVSFNGDWIQFPNDLRRMAKALPDTLKKATKQNALLLQREIKVGITNQAPGDQKFAPLKESTVKAKKSSKALINHGDLRRSITVTVFRGGEEAFVGVNRNATATAKKRIKGKFAAKRKDGQAIIKPLFDIAKVHEYGTASSNRHIPARPFIGPSFRHLKPDMIHHYERLLKSSLSQFKGKGGS